MSDKLLEQMIEVAGLSKKASYNPAEVCLLLGISYTTFYRMCSEFELTDEGMPKPGVLDSFRIRGERRVAFPELSRYLSENNSYHLEMSLKSSQLRLF